MQPTKQSVSNGMPLSTCLSKIRVHLYKELKAKEFFSLQMTPKFMFSIKLTVNQIAAFTCNQPGYQPFMNFLATT